MIIVLHGDNVETSRIELNRLKSEARGKEIRQLSGRQLDADVLVQALEAHSIFGGETFVIIENLFGKLGRKTKLIAELAEIINRANDTAVVLWEDRELGPAVLKNLGKPQVKLFKYPVLIFQFLDNLKPGNSKYIIPLFQKLVAAEPPEIIFSMIVRRFHQLIELADGVTPEGLAPWQASRLTTQAKSFTMDKLVAMHKRLLAIEYSTKTGASPFNLSQQIEMFLISL